MRSRRLAVIHPSLDTVATRSEASPEPDLLPSAAFSLDGRVFAVYRVPPGGRTTSVESRYWDQIKGAAIGTMLINEQEFLITRHAQAGIAPATRAPTATRDPLTQRETEIVQLVARGFTNKAIAAYLGISSWTVSTHLRRLFAKFQVDRRAALVFHLSASRSSVDGESAIGRDRDHVP